MKRTLFGLILVGLALVGCDSGGEKNTSGPTPKAAAGSLKVGLVFDSGGRGDKSFNDSAYAGLERAQSELGVEGKSIDSRKESDYETNLSAMAEQGCDLVIAVGLAQGNALTSVAPKFPDTKFAIVDASVEAPNVRSLLFTEEQGSYLAGYAAGLSTKTDKIGFVGGQKIPLIEKFEAGYTAGALAANPKITVLPSKYTGSWEDVALGKAAARTLFDQGADIVYHAAGRAGLGVIDAARDTKKYAIGVDGNQDDEAPGRVLTSMIKRVDNAVFQTIQDVKDGKFTAGAKVYDLASGGVGLSPFEHTKDVIGAENLKKIDAVAEELKSGKVKAPTTMAEVKRP